jgi:thioredoxin reductase
MLVFEVQKAPHIFDNIWGGNGVSKILNVNILFYFFGEETNLEGTKDLEVHVENNEYLKKKE